MSKKDDLQANISQTSDLLLNYMTLTADTFSSLGFSGYIEPKVFAPSARTVVSTHSPNSELESAFASHADPDVDNDLRQIAAGNAYKLKEFLGAKHLCMMRQVHGNQVNIVDVFSTEFAEQSQRSFLDVMMGDVPRRTTVTDDVTIIGGDGLVTNQLGCALVVLTADCLPLLLCDSKAGVIGAVHCGWKGIYKNIILNTIIKMQKLGARVENIAAYMGPAIGPKSFEVDEDLVLNFCLRNGAFKEAFEPEGQTAKKGSKKRKKVDGKYLCDIYKLCKICLTSLGVNDHNITGGEFDTYLQNNIFYSHRYNGTKGRIASAVMLN